MDMLEQPVGRAVAIDTTPEDDIQTIPETPAKRPVTSDEDKKFEPSTGHTSTVEDIDNIVESAKHPSVSTDADDGPSPKRANISSKDIEKESGINSTDAAMNDGADDDEDEEEVDPIMLYELLEEVVGALEGGPLTVESCATVLEERFSFGTGNPVTMKKAKNSTLYFKNTIRPIGIFSRPYGMTDGAIQLGNLNHVYNLPRCTISLSESDNKDFRTDSLKLVTSAFAEQERILIKGLTLCIRRMTEKAAPKLCAEFDVTPRESETFYLEYKRGMKTGEAPVVGFGQEVISERKDKNNNVVMDESNSPEMQTSIFMQTQVSRPEGKNQGTEVISVIVDGHPDSLALRQVEGGLDDIQKGDAVLTFVQFRGVRYFKTYDLYKPVVAATLVYHIPKPTIEFLRDRRKDENVEKEEKKKDKMRNMVTL